MFINRRKSNNSRIGTKLLKDINFIDKLSRFTRSLFLHLYSHHFIPFVFVTTEDPQKNLPKIPWPNFMGEYIHFIANFHMFCKHDATVTRFQLVCWHSVRELYGIIIFYSQFLGFWGFWRGQWGLWSLGETKCNVCDQILMFVIMLDK